MIISAYSTKPRIRGENNPGLFATYGLWVESSATFLPDSLLTDSRNYAIFAFTFPGMNTRATANGNKKANILLHSPDENAGSCLLRASTYRGKFPEVGQVGYGHGGNEAIAQAGPGQGHHLPATERRGSDGLGTFFRLDLNLRALKRKSEAKERNKKKEDPKPLVGGEREHGGGLLITYSYAPESSALSRKENSNG